MENYSSKIRELYTAFDGKNLSILESYYSQSVAFQDPAFSCQGLDALKAYYAHAYQHVIAIQFDFVDIFNSGNKYSASWMMRIRVRGLNAGKEYQVSGNSILHFDAEGLIEYHRDFLDLGEMVYERIPVQGFLIQKIKQRLRP